MCEPQRLIWNFKFLISCSCWKQSRWDVGQMAYIPEKSIQQPQQQILVFSPQIKQLLDPFGILTGSSWYNEPGLTGLSLNTHTSTHGVCYHNCFPNRVFLYCNDDSLVWPNDWSTSNELTWCNISFDHVVSLACLSAHDYTMQWMYWLPRTNRIGRSRSQCAAKSNKTDKIRSTLICFLRVLKSQCSYSINWLCKSTSLCT